MDGSSPIESKLTQVCEERLFSKFNSMQSSQSSPSCYLFSVQLNSVQSCYKCWYNWKEYVIIIVRLRQTKRQTNEQRSLGRPLTLFSPPFPWLQNHYVKKNKFGQLIDASFQPILSTWFEERRTDQQTCRPVEMQFYTSVMFLGLPDDIHKEKPSSFK